MITVNEFFKKGQKGPHYKPMAIRCDTLDQARTLMDMFSQETTAKWKDGERYSSTDPYWTDEFNCYSNNGGRCPEKWYRGNGFTVISFADIKTSDRADFQLYDKNTHEWY